MTKKERKERNSQAGSSKGAWTKGTTEAEVFVGKGKVLGGYVEIREDGLKRLHQGLFDRRQPKRNGLLHDPMFLEKRAPIHL